MEVTEVRIRRINHEGKMKAVASVTLDGEFVVHDVKVVEGQKGLFVAMPSRKTPDGEFRDVAHPITPAFRDRIQQAVLARFHEIPFYVVAPMSTFDPSMPSGANIPIEQRHPDEVRRVGSHLIAPENFPVYNPAFDVTPGSMITAIVTDQGILRPPYEAAITTLMARG